MTSGTECFDESHTIGSRDFLWKQRSLSGRARAARVLIAYRKKKSDGAFTEGKTENGISMV